MKFNMFVLGIIVSMFLVVSYFAIVGVIVSSRMPSVQDAPYQTEMVKYVSARNEKWNWFLSEDRILFKSGTMVLSDNGTIKLEVPNYWIRNGLDWEFVDEAVFWQYGVEDGKSRIIVTKVE